METGLSTITSSNSAVQAFSKQPISYCKRISDYITSIAHAVNYGSVTISQLNRECSDKLKFTLVKFIEGMLRYYGYVPDMEKTVSDGQVATLVNDICEKYYYLNIEDVCLCFKKARQSPERYGKFYGKFDASVVMNWFAMYDKERDEAIQSIKEEKPNVFTGEECSRDEYIEMLQARMAGGDLYANEALQRVGSFERIMYSNRIDYGNYKYWQKHRYDNR